MIYEERRYNVSAAKRQGFIEFFGNTVVPLLVKHGAKVIGVWETDIGEKNEVVCLLAFDDISERMKCWENFRKDEEFLKFVPSLPINSITNSILLPLKYSPLN